jgi:hypothetical protein
MIDLDGDTSEQTAPEWGWDLPIPRWSYLLLLQMWPIGVIDDRAIKMKDF